MTHAAPASSAYLIVGSDARMRVSSPMTPPLSGTLKSTRMKTRRPFRLRSRIVRLPRHQPATLQTARYDLTQQVDAAVRVAPLVVVPRQHLHEVAVHHLRVRRCRRSTSSGCRGSRSRRAARRTSRGCPSAAPFAASRSAALTSSPVVFFSTSGVEIDDRDVRRRHAHRRSRRACPSARAALRRPPSRRRWSSGSSTARPRARAADPCAAGRAGCWSFVYEWTVVIHAFLIAEALVNHLGERRQAVGRARRVRDDLVLRRDRTCRRSRRARP